MTADHWSIINLRDIVCNQRSFYWILINNNENTSSANWAKQLRRMCELKLLCIFVDPTHSQRKIYSLAAKGMDLIPIIVELHRLGIKHTSPSVTLFNFRKTRRVYCHRLKRIFLRNWNQRTSITPRMRFNLECQTKAMLSSGFSAQIEGMSRDVPFAFQKQITTTNNSPTL